jgi:hypothetical protein
MGLCFETWVVACARFAERLKLANAVRMLYLRTGKPLASLVNHHHGGDSGDSSNSSSSAASEPVELWASCGEEFVPLALHADALKRQLKDMEDEFRELRREVTGILSARKDAKAQRERVLVEAAAPGVKAAATAAAAAASRARALEDQVDALSLDAEKRVGRLKELKAQIGEARERLRLTQRPAGSTGGRRKEDSAGTTEAESAASPADGRDGGDIFQRLAKPVRPVRRVQARLNGNTLMHPEVCVGCTLEEVMDACAERLGLRAVKRLYDAQGQRLRTFEAIPQDADVYASCGEAWLDPEKLAKQVR